MKRIALSVAMVTLTALAYAQAPVAPGYTENFDAEPTCGTTTATVCTLVGDFTNSLDDTYDWLVDAGGTGSNPTGPQSGDHTTGSGNYLYCETSVPSALGDSRILLSPKLDVTLAANPQVGFWYHMFGTDIGTMHVDFVQQVNSGLDGIVTEDALGAGQHLISSASALFTASAAGDTVIVSGAVTNPAFNTTYTIVTVIDDNNVEVSAAGPLTGVAGTSEGGLTYDNNRTTLDIIPSFTDNQDLWQQATAPLATSFGAAGNTFTAQVAIRYLSGASFLGDAAIDDFEFIDALADDVGIGTGGIDAPTAVCIGDTANISVDVRNFGTNPQSNILVTLLLDGNVVVTDTIVGPLNGGQSQNLTFSAPINFVTPGVSTVDVLTVAAVDTNPANDFATTNTQVEPIIVVGGGTNYLEDFEGGAGGWVVEGSNTTWALGTPAKAVVNGAASGVNAWTSGGLTGQYNNNEDGAVVSPCFDTSSMGSSAAVRLNVWWESEFSWDGMSVQYTNDAGATWNNIGVFGDPANWYTDDTTVGMTPFGASQDAWTGRTTSSNGSNGYVSAVNFLPAGAIGPAVRFRVTFGSDGSVQWEGNAFDDFELVELNTNPFPGSNEDLDMEIAINGANVTDGFTSTAPVMVGETFSIVTNTPLATYDNAPYALVADVFATGGAIPTPISPIAFPEAHISLAAQIVFDGTNTSAAGLSYVVTTAGSAATFNIPSPLASGASVLLQSLVLDPGAANGFFAITDGRVIEVQ